jgi:hypothetical protein
MKPSQTSESTVTIELLFGYKNLYNNGEPKRNKIMKVYFNKYENFLEAFHDLRNLIPQSLKAIILII